MIAAGRGARLRAAMIVALVAAMLTACGYSGISSLPVPGAAGTANGSYRIRAEIPNAAGLVNNAPVLMNDVTVGSIGKISVNNWHAALDIRLDPGVRVPRGSHVMVGATSVLGSVHLEIVAPEQGGAGYLRAGDEIPLPACPPSSNLAAPQGKAIPDVTSAQQVPGCSYPTTEQVLSALSVVLNGGGVAQFGDVVHEMSAVFNGHQKSLRALTPRLNTLVGDLDRQKSSIIAAMVGLDRMTGVINAQAPTVEKALTDGPRILKVLNDQRDNFVTALDALGRLSSTTNDVLDANTRDIETIIANMRPALKGFADAGPALPGSLRLLLTFPFLEEMIPTIVKGDYVNSDLVLDLTFENLGNTILRSAGVVGPEGVTGKPAGTAKRGLNPFTAPLQPGGERQPDSSVPVPAPRVGAGGG